MLEKIAIIGAGGFGREVKMLIDQINDSETKYSFIGFFDDNTDLKDLTLGVIEDLNFFKEELSIVIAIGNPITKKSIYNRLANKLLKFPTLIHPNVLVGKTRKSRFGKGCIITAGNIFTVDFNIGNFVTLNLSCTVGHDAIIDDYCSIMPGVNISGEVHIEECVYVGTGAKVINNINIGKNTTVGAGSVVLKTLPSNCVAVGVPSKIIKLI